MSDIRLEKQGCIGRITLTRTKALNALSVEMAEAIAPILPVWAADPEIKMLVIDAEGERAFCAGGDVTDLYRWGIDNQIPRAQEFWRGEYAMNAALHDFPKPIAAFMHGFVMGGGVGLGCHSSHRIVCDSTRMSMPEVAIGLVPDVGGSWLLARAPGRLGEYMATTCARMGPGDAIYAGFADYFIPEDVWPALIEKLAQTGDWELIDAAAQPAPDSPMQAQQAQIDELFAGETWGDIRRLLAATDTEFAAKSLATAASNSPLSMAASVALIHQQRSPTNTIQTALMREYRYTHRSFELADFVEGVRALLIDKDKSPKWRHAPDQDPTTLEVSRLLMPLGADELRLPQPGETP